jgi:glycosyltransferase involved in cell wall biosynthesis
MNNSEPLVSIGMPVFNGEEFLAAALDALLAQTYSRLEIILFDNASTDGTRRICESYAARDPRIHYHRNNRNLGAARNYNLTLAHATGRYFKWAAHDDLCLPAFIRRCVETLESNPDVVLAYPKTIVIDSAGRIIDDQFEDRYDIRDRLPHQRYRAFSQTPLDCNPVFGVIRTDNLKKTPGIGPYESSDRVLLGELALRGKIAEVPERLFLRRYHKNISTFACATKKQMATWFDPTSSGRFTRLHRFVEYVRSIRRVPLSPGQRCSCLHHLLRFYIRMYLEPERWGKLLGKMQARFLSGASLSFVELKKREVC